MNRTILSLATAAAVTLSAAGPALAADVSKFTVNADLGSFNMADISFKDANRVTITMPTKGYIDFADTVKLTTEEPSCVSLQGGAHVQCDGTGIAELGVNATLGNGNDSALLMPPPAGFTYWAAGLQGMEGSDTLESRGPATMFWGGNGDDRLISGPAADEIYGEAGQDVVDYSGRTAPVNVDLITDQPVNGAVGEKDKIKGVEDVLGGAGADKLTGSDGPNEILGGKGADTISAKGGQDTIEARDSVKDTISCGAGSDTVEADNVDTVSADCETVHRGGTPAGPGIVGQPKADPPPLPIPPPPTKPGDPANPSDPANPGNPANPGDPSNPANPGADKTAPKLSKVAFAPRTFRAAKGSALRLTLTEAATVAIKVERLSRGRLSGRTCRKETAKLRRRHAKPCTRGTKVTIVKATGMKAGAGRAKFSGKVRKRTLKPGSYRATLVATDAAGNASKPVATKFFVKR